MGLAQGAFFDVSLQERLQNYQRTLADDYAHFLGFPASLDYDYSELAPFMQLFLNNVGDPYVNAWHGMHSKDFEREVVTFFAELFRAPEDDFWGYITNGGTECNLYALYVARQKYPQGVVYYSSDAHYSIPKNIHLLGMDGQVVRAQPRGEMDYEDLRAQLTKHADRPAIVVATIGTTISEAKDNVAVIKQVLSEAGNANHYIHADAALAGVYVALTTPRHPFDFADGADSIGISGHKFIGSPMPCGVVLVRKRDREHLRAVSNYTGSVDSTISGSRNGHAALLLWYAIQRFGRDGFKRRALAGQKMAAYAHTELLGLGLHAWRNPDALTVVLPAPPRDIIVKWQLATANGWSHVICMPGVTYDRLNAFLADIAGVVRLSSKEFGQERALAVVGVTSN